MSEPTTAPKTLVPTLLAALVVFSGALATVLVALGKVEIYGNLLLVQTTVATLAGATLLVISLRARQVPQATAPAIVAAPPPTPAAPAKADAQSEIVHFLAILQEKGRFVDFIMEDVTPYTDAQIGAGARVVHQGCKSVFKEMLSLSPALDGKENTTVTIESGFDPERIRLVGKVGAQAPFSGKLVHKGWRVESMKLPQFITDSTGKKASVIAPAQVELS